MQDVIISEASANDFTAIVNLLKENNLPVNDIAQGKQIFFKALQNDTLVGCIGLEIYEKAGLLRSLAISDLHKNSGIGKKLYNVLLNHSLEQNLLQLILLTTTAKEYFKKFDWVETERSKVPATIQTSSEFAALCPSTATCMQLSLIPIHAEMMFADGLNCAQSAFYPFAIKQGVNPEHALKLATGFGAGMVYRGETCGAITGSMMSIGLTIGRFDANDYDSKDKTYMLINELYKIFKEKHGSILCKELLKLEGEAPECWQNAGKKGLFDTHCPKYVKDAAEITEKLLIREAN